MNLSRTSMHKSTVFGFVVLLILGLGAAWRDGSYFFLSLFLGLIIFYKFIDLVLRRRRHRNKRQQSDEV